MDEFARRAAADRRAFIAEAAARRDLLPLIIEKDFWVCWTLRRLARSPGLKDQMTFKGGTSLSKGYGIIQRFSEDIDLTIRRDAPCLDKVASPMDEGLTGKERERRTKALKAAARDYVAKIAMPVLTDGMNEALGTAEGWTIELDPDDAEQQTLLFNYPRTDGYGLNYGNGWGGANGASYIKPRVKLEFGARGEPEPHEPRTIRPYLADEFPDALPDADTLVDTLSVNRTYWEKATILHALHHNGKLRDGLSRHYYDLLQLDHAGVTAGALADAGLLARVVENKRLMFADASASYGTAVLATLRLVPTGALRDKLAVDYKAMSDMFMAQPPSFDALVAGLEALQQQINAAAPQAGAVVA
jgi:hypothetical protein